MGFRMSHGLMKSIGIDVWLLCLSCVILERIGILDSFEEFVASAFWYVTYEYCFSFELLVMGY